MTSRSKKTYLFKNENFGVRETLEDDIETWYKWFNDPEVNKYLSPHGNIPNTLEAQKNFRNRHLSGRNGRIIFSIEESKKNEIIGTCSINIDFLGSKGMFFFVFFPLLSMTIIASIIFSCCTFVTHI